MPLELAQLFGGYADALQVHHVVTVGQFCRHPYSSIGCRRARTAETETVDGGSGATQHVEWYVDRHHVALGLSGTQSAFAGITRVVITPPHLVTTYRHVAYYRFFIQ